MPYTRELASSLSALHAVRRLGPRGLTLDYPCFSERGSHNRLVRRPLRKPLLAAVVLPLVVIVGFQSAWASFACRVDGIVRDECCCKHDKREKEQPADSAPHIAPQNCCDVSIYEHRDAPLARETERAAFHHDATIIEAPAFAVVSPRIASATAIVAMARPPPPRIALFLDKHALLR